jgi:hypothetical protein
VRFPFDVPDPLVGPSRDLSFWLVTVLEASDRESSMFRGRAGRMVGIGIFWTKDRATNTDQTVRDRVIDTIPCLIITSKVLFLNVSSCNALMHFCFLRDTRRCRQKDDDTDDIIFAALGLGLRTLPLLVASRGSSSILPSRRVMAEGEFMESVKLYWFLHIGGRSYQIQIGRFIGPIPVRMFLHDRLRCGDG